MELFIDKLIDILKDVFKDGFDLGKASLLIAILIAATCLWQRKSLKTRLKAWRRKIAQADTVDTLTERVQDLEDAALQPLKELYRNNEEFKLKIKSLTDQAQQLYVGSKISDSERNTLADELQSLHEIYEHSIQDLILLSSKLSEEISASRQSLIDAPRWSREEGWKDFKQYKSQQKKGSGN